MLGHDYWSYVEGANAVVLDSGHKDFSMWEQVASRVLYCLTSRVHDQMLGYIRDAKMPKDFHRKYRDTEVAAHAKVQQYPAKGHIS